MNRHMKYVVRCAIWYHLYNLKNVKNAHGGLLILAKLQALPATLLKLTLLHGYFSRFLNCTNGNKTRNAPHITTIKNVDAVHYHLVNHSVKKLYENQNYQKSSLNET